MKSAVSRVRLNICRRGTAWCYTTSVDGYQFATGLLPVEDNAPVTAAIAAARALYEDDVTITRNAYLPSANRKPAKQRGRPVGGGAIVNGTSE